MFVTGALMIAWFGRRKAESVVDLAR
jgi:hypothetical protein